MTKEIQVATFVDSADVLRISESGCDVVGVCFRAWDAGKGQYVETFGAVERKALAGLIEW